MLRTFGRSWLYGSIRGKTEASCFEFEDRYHRITHPNTTTKPSLDAICQMLPELQISVYLINNPLPLPRGRDVVITLFVYNRTFMPRARSTLFENRLYIIRINFQINRNTFDLAILKNIKVIRYAIDFESYIWTYKIQIHLHIKCT